MIELKKAFLVAMIVFLIAFSTKTYAITASIYQEGTEADFVSGLTNATSVTSGTVTTGNGNITFDSPGAAATSVLLTTNIYDKYTMTATIYGINTAAGNMKFGAFLNNNSGDNNAQSDAKRKIGFMFDNNNPAYVYMLYQDASNNFHSCSAISTWSDGGGEYFQLATPFNISLEKNDTAYNISVYNSDGSINRTCSILKSAVKNGNIGEWLGGGDTDADYWSHQILYVRYLNITYWIEPAVSNTTLYIDGANANATHDYSTADDNFTAIANISNMNISIFADDTLLNTSLTSSVQFYDHFGVGVHNITALSFKDNTILNSSETLWFTITQATANCSFNITPESDVFYGTNYSFECNCSNLPNAELEDNGANITAFNHGSYSADVATHNFTCYSNGDANYSYGSTNKTYSVTFQASSPTYSICINNQTLLSNKTVFYNGVKNNTVEYFTCLHGCDNITFSCNPPEFEQNLSIFGLIMGSLIIFVFILKRRK